MANRGAPPAARPPPVAERPLSQTPPPPITGGASGAASGAASVPPSGSVGRAQIPPSIAPAPFATPPLPSRVAGGATGTDGRGAHRAGGRGVRGGRGRARGRGMASTDPGRTPPPLAALPPAAALPASTPALPPRPSLAAASLDDAPPPPLPARVPAPVPASMAMPVAVALSSPRPQSAHAPPVAKRSDLEDVRARGREQRLSLQPGFVKSERRQKRRSWDPSSVHSGGTNQAPLKIEKSMLFMGAKETPTEKKQRRRRAMIMNEIVATERTYANALQKLVEVFMQPLIEREYERTITDSEAAPDSVSEEERNALFGNVEDICALSTKYLAKFEARIAESQESMEISVWFSDIFDEMVHDPLFFSGYSTFINQYTVCTTKIDELHANPHTPLAQFVEEASENPLLGNDTLASLLITPIQRVPRYVLFLTDLLKSTPSDYEQHGQLFNVLTAMQALATRLNEKKRYSEATNRFLQSLQIQVTGEYMLADGQMMTPAEDRPSQWEFVHVFLFHNQIICARKTKDSELLLMWQIQLMNASFVENEAKDRFIFTEVRTITKYPFVFCTEFRLRPQKKSEMNLWRNNFSIAFSNFWSEKEKRQADATALVTHHVCDKLLTDDDWKVLSLGAKELSFGAGEVVLRRGEAISSLYYVLDGSVRAELDVKEGEGSRTVVLDTMEKGRIFGELSMLSGKLNTASTVRIVAECPCDLLIMARKAITRVLVSQPKLSIRFYEYLCYMLASRFIKQPLRTALGKKQTSHSGSSATPSLADRVEGSVRLFDGVDTPEPSVNEKYLSKLKLETETIVRCYDCEFSKMSGVLVLMSEHVGFYGKIFGRRVSQAWHRGDVHQARIFKEIPSKKRKGQTLRPGIVMILIESLEEKQFLFEDAQIRDEAFALISNLLGKTTKFMPGHLKPSDIFQRTASWTSAEFREEARRASGSSALTEDDWLFLSQYAERITYSKGEKVLSSGDRPLALFQITHGSCHAELPSDSSDPLDAPRVVGKLEQGEVFGEIGFVLGLRCTASIVADEECVVSKFPRTVLDQIFKCGADTGGESGGSETQVNEDIGAAFYHYLARNLRDLFVKSEMKLYTPAEEEVKSKNACAGCGRRIRSNPVKLRGLNYHQDCMDDAVRSFKV